MATARWNIAVSPDTDKSVRMYLAAEGRGRRGELSRFIEEAVRDAIFERSVRAAKAATAGVDPDELEKIIDEAVDWARAQ